MTKKQREALTALRDVMREYDIAFEAGYVGGACELTIKGDPVAGHDDSLFQINTGILAKILEQETE